MRYLLFVALFGCSANDDIPSPLIASLNPSHGPAGAIIMVDGQYFCQAPVDQQDPVCDATIGTVSFDSVPGIVSAYTDTAIMVEVPSSLSGSVTVRVTAAGRTSNAASFTAD
jgi:hypothetical protein